MLDILGFIFENSVRNTAPIILGASLTALSVGRIVGSTPSIRIALYICGGVICGLWTYAEMDIPDRALQFMEGFYLSIGMVVIGAIFVFPTVFFAEARRRDS
jgi:hypothetical protein